MTSLQIYNNNALLKAAGVQVPFTQQQVQEYIKCSKDPLYFIKTYAKIVSLDDGVVPFIPFPYQERIIESIHKNQNTLGKLFRQAGKALPLDTLIPTPTGFVPMKDIHTGDVVFGADGQLCNVVAESDVQHLQMYKITFDNGDTVVACQDHQWMVYDRINTREKTPEGKYTHAKLVLTTQQIAESNWYRENRRGYKEYAYYIPNTAPVNYPTSFLQIDPYVLGVWLGDGTSADNSFTFEVSNKSFFESQGIHTVKRNSSDGKNAVTERIVGLTHDDLRLYDLIKNKHIPRDYLFGDVQQRISLLQGLMDTDGFISERSGTCHIQLSAKNQHLLEDVYTLLCSLGLKPTTSTFEKTNSVRYSFSCPRSKFDVFRIPHKLTRQPSILRHGRYVESRTIQNIEPLEELQLGKCIQVDNADSMYLCGREYVPTHNSTIVAAYFAWYVLFNDNKTAVILANKQAIAIEIFGRVQFIIENLPQWLQQGVIEWNKKSLVLENGSRCVAAATSASAVRGMSVNVLLCDEFAHLKPNLAEEFIASVFPTLSSSDSSKLVIISTPNGLNHYHKLWKEAENGLNDFRIVEGKWQENPKRSQQWADEQRKKLGEVKYNQEIECVFSGSSYTLVDGAKLATLTMEQTIFEKDGLEVFEHPNQHSLYTITVDVSRGRHMDYSAFSVIDITQMPYKVVATYKNNEISTLEFPHLIYNTARQYNDAFILIEINDLGEEVSNTIWQEYEYENLYFTNGNELSQTRGYPGVRTTSKVKSLGCSVLKELIEKDQLVVNSHRIIEELGLFVMHKKSYATQDPQVNDDLCTTLWMFAWLTKQEIFQQLTNIHLRTILTERKQQYIDSTMTPFGFFQNNKPDNLSDEILDNRRLPNKQDPYHLTEDQIELLNF